MRVQRVNLLFHFNPRLQARKANGINMPHKLNGLPLPKPVMCVTPEEIFARPVSDQYRHLPIPFTFVNVPFFKEVLCYDLK